MERSIIISVGDVGDVFYIISPAFYFFLAHVALGKTPTVTIRCLNAAFAAANYLNFCSIFQTNKKKVFYREKCFTKNFFFTEILVSRHFRGWNSAKKKKLINSRGNGCFLSNFHWSLVSKYSSASLVNYRPSDTHVIFLHCVLYA